MAARTGLNILYANTCGGFLFAGQEYGEMLFRKVDVGRYATHFATKAPDILALSEVHFETEDGERSDMLDLIADHSPELTDRASVVFGESFLDTSKYIGMSIMSKYPIVTQERFTLPNPKLQVVRPDGEQWTMLDKAGLRATLDIDGVAVDVVTFAFHPLHHFNRRVDEPEFTSLRQQLTGILLSGGHRPTIVPADFNNKNVPLPLAFPELLENGRFRRAVVVDTTVVGSNHQLDEILVTADFDIANPFAERNDSDHYEVGARLTLN